MIEIGSEVRIKDNAYEGSLEPDNILARGKIGTVIYIRNDEIEVLTEDDEFQLLTIDEVEEIK